jgi:hypothetical protein
MQKGKTYGPGPRSRDITGETFGRLTAICFVAMNHNHKQVWRFKCTCGTLTDKVANSAMSDAKKGRNPGCGCKQFAGNHRTHGLHGTYEYGVWKALRQRCFSKNQPGYKNYGGRGITVCERWEEFSAFLEDMGKAPSEKHSIDRIDNDGDYTPENCRWATRAEQRRNSRQLRMVTYRGKTQCLKDWATELGIKYSALYRRVVLREQPAELAFSRP